MVEMLIGEMLWPGPGPEHSVSIQHIAFGQLFNARLAGRSTRCSSDVFMGRDGEASVEAQVAMIQTANDPDGQ